MLSILLKLLSGPLIASVMGVINKHYDVKMNKDTLQADIEKAVLGTITDVASTQADVIKAEIQSEDKITRIWRPLVALSFAFVILFYALIVPITVGYFGAPAPKIGDKLLEWVVQLCTLCLGGYVAGRSLEKITELVFSRWRK